MRLSSIEVLHTQLKNTNKISHEILFVSEFEKDGNNLSKEFNTLWLDLKVFIETGLKLYHNLKVDNEGIKPVDVLDKDSPKIYEAEKFACRSLKGKGAKSGIKVIYAYFEKEKRIELIEIFYNQHKENADKERILKYYRSN